MVPDLMTAERDFAICAKSQIGALVWHDSKVVCLLSNQFDPRASVYKDTGLPAKFSVPLSGLPDALPLARNGRTKFPKMKQKGSRKLRGGFICLPEGAEVCQFVAFNLPEMFLRFCSAGLSSALSWSRSKGSTC